MKVNMISERGGWIIERCARELHERLGWEVNSRQPCDISYHLPMWRGLDPDAEKRTSLRIGFFTHGFNRANAMKEHFDAAVCMNRRMLMHTQFSGNQERPVRLIRPGVDAPAKMPTFGVAGRTYRDGRKGQDLVKKATAEGYDFLSLGPGPWPCESAGADPTKNAFFGFWNKIDYYVVTSNDEGGPMPALEAIAHRVPVIAPDVGFCWELPVIRYARGDWESLRSVLHELTVTPTWAEWAEQHEQFFAKIWKQREEVAA